MEQITLETVNQNLEDLKKVVLAMRESINDSVLTEVKDEIELRQEFSNWDSLSDEALNTFEKNLDG